MGKHGKKKKKGKGGRKPRPGGGQHVERLDIDMSELEAILERVKAVLSEEEYKKIHAALETLLFLTQELEKKRVSIQKLKKLLFGAATEKTKDVIKTILEQSRAGGVASRNEQTGNGTKEGERKGHGRNGAAAYSGGEKVRIPHESLKEGDPCPKCPKGKLYRFPPGFIVRIKGQAPLSATVYELEKLRCNLCGEVFSAKVPQGVGEEKYDAESASMIGLLKYGSGLPFNRLQRLQEALGIPLPAATQWEIVEKNARLIAPAFEELVRQAAQGEVVHNDDTTMKILGLSGRAATDGTERKGVFTSGIVSLAEGRKVALFFTGPSHAGEELVDLLKRRASELDPPIQMCDALSRNMPEELQTIVANCLAHGRRRFVDVAANFPEECVHVLNVLKDVYRNDALAREKDMSPEERLRFHEAESGPLMEGLHTWMESQLEERKVEPNSGLGEAITYMLKHWEELTLFLRVPRAPLDNNVCERVLKKAILHRKNSYFYKTEKGAGVGDLYMSLIHTCELNGQNPFDYLAELQKHAKELLSSPEDWMPWNYRHTLEESADSEPR